MSQLAQRYATALFELAQEMAVVDSWQTQMQLVHTVFVENKEYISFMAHYRVGDESKKEVLMKAFSGKVDKEVLHFLCLLVDKKRIRNVLDIAASFHSLCNESKNIKEGYVYSIKPLDKETIKRIEVSIGERLDCEIDLINRIDTQLISGIKVVIDDQVMDGSMRYRMNSLKTELLKESR